MRIKAIHVRELAMRLIKPFETSFGVMHKRRVVLVSVETDGGVGWGELPVEAGPFYNSEFTDAAWLVLRDFLSPTVLGKDFTDISAIVEAMRSIRGHEIAKAALENAVWDALARERGISLRNLLGGTRKEISCGVSLGIHLDTSELIDRIGAELAAGYQRIKLKIKPGKDISVVAAVRKRYPDIVLTVDANSAYRLEDRALLKQLDDFDLAYIEQPLAWNEIYEHVALQNALNTPICLDECIHTLRDARAAIQLGACKVINIKLCRVSGHSEARNIQQYCLEHHIPAWCGGMLEAGVGRAHNIAMSSLPGFVLPGDVSASERYWDQDIISPQVRVNRYGTISVPEGPGIGFNIDEKFVDKLTVRVEHWGEKGDSSSYPEGAVKMDEQM